MFIDQRWLPDDFRIDPLEGLSDFAAAIRDIWVRDAPLIGATAAYGMTIAITEDATEKGLRLAYDTLIAARPAAINLRWALDRAQKVLIHKPSSER